jgi:hypothetical protein
MKLSAALEYENIRRDQADWNKIYLNHDGKFFHAYEWSAWLIKAVACTEEFQQQRGDAKMLTAMLYTTKNSECYGTFDSDMTTFTLRSKPTARLST